MDDVKQINPKFRFSRFLIAFHYNTPTKISLSFFLDYGYCWPPVCIAMIDVEKKNRIRRILSEPKKKKKLLGFIITLIVNDFL